MNRNNISVDLAWGRNLGRLYVEALFAAKTAKGKTEAKRLQKKAKKNDQKLHRIEQVHWQTYQKLCEANFKV